MTEGLAIEIAKQKMMELGIGENYFIRFRHLVLSQNEIHKIKSDNDLVILLLPNKTIKVSSKSGLFDVTDEGIKEQQYVHSGSTIVENINPSGVAQVKFLHVIPKLI
jgi:hypothetical protein